MKVRHRRMLLTHNNVALKRQSSRLANIPSMELERELSSFKLSR